MDGELEMNIFLEGLEESPELEEELTRINPSEDVKSPESVASKNDQDREASNQNSPQDIDEEEEDENLEKEEQSPENASLYSSLANVLFKEGALPSLDLEKTNIDDVDGLVGAIKKEIEANEYGNLNDRQKRYLDVLKAGIPEEAFFEAEQVSYNLENITEEFIESEDNSEFREGIIKEYFLLKGFDEEESTSLTQQQMDLANDIVFSKKAIMAIQEYNNSKLQDKLDLAKEEQKAQVKSATELKEMIDKTDSIIDGLTIDKADKKDILDIISKPVETLENGVQLNKIMKLQMDDPIGFQHKIAYLIHLTKGLEDFSAFTTVKRAKSRAVKDFEKVLKKSTLDLSESPITDGESFDIGSDFMLDL